MRQLRSICREVECLPMSCIIQGDMALSQRPVSSSAYSDVYKGRMGGQAVALKSLRIHASNQSKVLKVGNNIDLEYCT